MKLNYLVIASLLMAVLAISGCTSPAASPTPSPSPTEAPTATPAPTVTPTPEPTATPTPTATPVPVYSNNSPVSVSQIKIDWDTTHYNDRATQTATMTVKNTLGDGIVQDVEVLYKVATPAVFVNPDGSYENRTTTVTATQHIGLMQAGEQRDLTFQLDHTKNLPATVSVTITWRGGSAVVFNKTLEMPDHSFGTFEL